MLDTIHPVLQRRNRVFLSMLWIILFFPWIGCHFSALGLKKGISFRFLSPYLLVDKWTSLYEEQSGSERCQEMPWWREKYWGLQELPRLLNKRSMMLLQSRLCCFHYLSLPCLYICCKEKIGWTYMGGIPSSLSTELLLRKASRGTDG